MRSISRNLISKPKSILKGNKERESSEIMIETRIIEEKIRQLFSVKKPFSEHFSKWEDDLLPDKYDHNCFEYSAQPSKEEFRKALDYQKNLGASFIKLEGDAPLDDDFGLEKSITATMVLKNKACQWKQNSDLVFRAPTLPELTDIEVKHYGKVYGEDFCRRNMARLFDKFTYHGAYIGNHLVGACYSYTDDNMTCIDGLIVDEDFRKQYIATSLIAHIKELHPNDTLLLHADMEDTPKDMYIKMGFEIVDKLYEYSCQDLSKKK